MAFEKLREGVAEIQKRAALKSAISRLDLSHGFNWKTLDVFSVPGLPEYVNALSRVDETVRTIIARPQDVFLGKAPDGIHLVRDLWMTRVSEPPSDVWSAEITSRRIPLDTPNFQATLEHIVRIVSQHANIPEVLTDHLVREAAQSLRERDASALVRIGKRWNLVVYPMEGADNLVRADAFLVPVEQPEYVEAWKHEHRKPIEDAMPVGIVREKFLKAAHKNYRVDRVELTEPVYDFDIGGRKEVAKILRKRGWTKVTDKDALAFIESFWDKHPGAVYEYKRGIIYAPFLGVDEYEGAVIISAIATPVFRRGLQEAYYRTFTDTVRDVFWEVVHKARESGETHVDVSPLTLVAATLARTHQGIKDYYFEHDEAPKLSRIAAVMLRDVFSSMDSPALVQLGTELGVQITRDEEVESGISVNWHTEMFQIKIPVAQIGGRQHK